MHRTEGYLNSSNLYIDGAPGTYIEAAHMNTIQEEICNVIEQAGNTVLVKATDTRTQLYEAIVDILSGAVYSSIMAGNETFTETVGTKYCYILNPNGSDRNFNPSGTFTAGFEATIINTASANYIIFDSTGIVAYVAPGTKSIFRYNGATWVGKNAFQDTYIKTTATTGNGIDINANSVTDGNGISLSCDGLNSGGIGLYISSTTNAGSDLIMLDPNGAFAGDALAINGGSMLGYGLYINGGTGSATQARIESGTRTGKTLEIISAGNKAVTIAHSEPKTDHDYGVTVENTSTSSTASKYKYGIHVTSTGTWNGAGAINYGIYVAEPTGGTYNIGLCCMGRATFGTSSTNDCAIVTMASTTRGFLPPKQTSAQKGAIASPQAGLIVYDTDLNKLCVYTGAGWETVTSV